MKVAKNFPPSAADRIGNAARRAFQKVKEEVSRFDSLPEVDRLPVDMQVDTDDDPPPTYTHEVIFAPEMDITMTYSFLVWIIRTYARLDYGVIRWVKWNNTYGVLIFPKNDSWLQVKPQVRYLFGDAPRPEYDDGE